MEQGKRGWPGAGVVQICFRRASCWSVKGVRKRIGAGVLEAPIHMRLILPRVTHASTHAHTQEKLAELYSWGKQYGWEPVVWGRDGKPMVPTAPVMLL